MADPNAEVRQYDPALVEAAREGDEEDEISLIARVPYQSALPSGVRVVTRFGDIVTLRATRASIAALAESPAVVEMEAPRVILPADGVATEEDEIDEGAFDDAAPEVTAYTRRPAGLEATGEGVVVGVLDWGIDFAHPAFRNSDGTTRFVAIWDQRGATVHDEENRWGYGRIFDSAEIDRALGADDPYAALGYHPADAEERSARASRAGTHGTHVLDIAAGSERHGPIAGVAPNADLVFVHLARTTQVLGRGHLGDSASLLEAIDFAFTRAGERPCSVNMSVGAHGGPHDGTTLVEAGIDRAVWLEPGLGRAVINSVGNYARSGAHRHGRIRQGEEINLSFRVPAHDPTPSELEVWYSGADRFVVSVLAPDGHEVATLPVGGEETLSLGGQRVGMLYHVRAASNAEHHIDLFLNPDAPSGIWSIHLRGDRVIDGRFYSWIERERGLRPVFVPRSDDTRSTTGTLCNGAFSIAVGAYDPHDASRRIARFSSGGPTRDGRIKPELLAPGVRISAARSTPRSEPTLDRSVGKSGSSMAAPHVTGAVALLFEVVAKPIDIADTRALLFSAADRPTFDDDDVVAGPDIHRAGYGFLNLVALEQAARRWKPVVPNGEQEMSDHIFDESEGEGGELAETQRDESEEARPSDPSVIRRDPHTPKLVDAEEQWESEQSQELEQPQEFAQTQEFEESQDIEWTPEFREPSEISSSSPFPSPEAAPASFAESFLDMSANAEISDADHLRSLAASALNVENVWEAATTGGSFLDGVRPGDLLIRSAPAQGIHHTSVVLSTMPEHASDLAERGIVVESGVPGLYVEVAEVPLGGGPMQIIGRRLADSWGRVPRGQTLLRPAPTDTLTEVDVGEPDLAEGVRRGCIAPSKIPGIDSREASVFGAVAEEIIYADFYRSNFSAAAPPRAIFRDDNNPAGYIAFLAFNNPFFDTVRQEDYFRRLSADRMVRIPDFIIHTASEQAFYEVKPGSKSGIRAGQGKVGTLQAVYQFYSLPYTGGTRFNPRDHRIALLGSALQVRLKVRRIAPGLITYKICLESDAPIELVTLAILLRYIVREVNKQHGRGTFRPVDLQPALQTRQLGDLARILGLTMATAATAAVVRATWKHFWKAVVRRFAMRGVAAATMSAADGPLPVGELLSLGLGLWTVVDIIRLSDELWRDAESIAREGA